MSSSTWRESPGRPHRLRPMSVILALLAMFGGIATLALSKRG